MIRLGLVDFDTSHAVEFTKRLNHVDVGEDHWVEGARVVAGVPGRSEIAPESIARNAEWMRRFGVPLFDDPADLFGKVDAVLIEASDGGVHRERALPFLERGIATFVDKPFACSVDDAKAMVDLAARKHVALMSSSSLRFAPEVVESKADPGKAGPIVGVATHGPAPLDAKGRNPGLFHYGIHPVEMLYALMGPGCERLTCLGRSGVEVVTGVWAGNRMGTVRGIRKGHAAYGFTLYGEKGIVHRPVSTQYIYRELLHQVVAMFATGEPPIPLRETLEIVAFIDAARRSADDGGAAVELRF